MAWIAEQAATVLWWCVGIGPLCHIYLCPGLLQHPAVNTSWACCNDILLFYCSPLTSSTTLPSRLVAAQRVLKPAISALTNKLNNKRGEKAVMGHVYWHKIMLGHTDRPGELLVKVNELTTTCAEFQCVGVINLNTACEIFHTDWGKCLGEALLF